MPEMEPIIKLFQTQMRMEQEGHILKAVADVGVHVNKERLLKALQDARSFYEEGYEAGLNSHSRNGQWDAPIEHGLPHYANHLGVVCSYCCSWADNKYNYCPNCGAYMKDGDES